MLDTLESLFKLARDRKNNPVEGSYTNKLLNDKSSGTVSGLFSTFDNSYADCHLLVALPILTWFKSSDASFVSYVMNLKSKKNIATKIAIINGIKKKE